MKYFLDTEFLEGEQDKRFLGFKTGKKTKQTIELISIGIVAEDGREYYAISKDFNLKEAWNRYQIKDNTNNVGYRIGCQHSKIREYWIRENVLKPIWKELTLKGINDSKYCKNHFGRLGFNYSDFKCLINHYGKTNQQIAEEVKEFVYSKEDVLYNHEDCRIDNIGEVKSDIEFYAYYADYDWVVFCWLFGKIIDLPGGFPRYCKDLKEILDDKVNRLNGKVILHYLEDKTFYGLEPHEDVTHTSVPATKTIYYDKMSFKDKLNFVKNQYYSYPKQQDQHNALADARWNKKLYEFLMSINEK